MRELNRRTTYAILIDPGLRDRLRVFAARHRRKVYEVLEEALERFLAEAEDGDNAVVEDTQLAAPAGQG